MRMVSYPSMTTVIEITIDHRTALHLPSAQYAPPGSWLDLPLVLLDRLLERGRMLLVGGMLRFVIGSVAKLLFNVRSGKLLNSGSASSGRHDGCFARREIPDTVDAALHC